MAALVQTQSVSQAEAQALCEAQGKRLCHDIEWERACKGPESKIWSYGNYYDQEFCGEGIDDPYTSGKREDCRSGYGVYDLSGNFIEWTGTQSKSGRYLTKGGKPTDAVEGTRCAFATDEAAGHRSKALSFRCCRDVDAPPPPRPQEPKNDTPDGAPTE